jgi:hypothetical protein
MGEGRKEDPGKSRNFFLRLPFGGGGLAQDCLNDGRGDDFDEPSQVAKPWRRVRREPLKTRFLCRDGRGSPSEKRYESTFWSKPPDVCGCNT